MNDNNDQMKKLLQVLNSTSQGLESSVTKEVLSGTVEETGTLIEIEKKSELAEDNSIVETVIFKMPVFLCGCLSQGRNNVGVKCSRCNHISCNQHSYRCLRCHKPLCINCRRQLHFGVFCNRCFFLCVFIRPLLTKYLRAVPPIAVQMQQAQNPFGDRNE
jgi:hypothetical protein